MKTKTRVEFTRSHARGQVNTGCDTCKGGRKKCPGRTVNKMSVSTSVDTRQNYKTQITTPGLMPGGVIMQNIQQWKANRKAEAERKAAYMANLKLPFVAEYGEHKVKQGDIYALVVHTNDSASEHNTRHRPEGTLAAGLGQQPNRRGESQRQATTTPSWEHLTVKYYTAVKRLGNIYLYLCDEFGSIAEGTKGKLRREPTIKAYRKVA